MMRAKSTATSTAIMASRSIMGARHRARTIGGKRTKAAFAGTFTHSGARTAQKVARAPAPASMQPTNVAIPASRYHSPWPGPAQRSGAPEPSKCTG